jgi:hypothetical protein
MPGEGSPIPFFLRIRQRLVNHNPRARIQQMWKERSGGGGREGGGTHREEASTLVDQSGLSVVSLDKAR